MNYYTFNLWEAIFWIVLGGTGFAMRNIKRRTYKRLAVYASVVFILFGLSDILEIFVGNFFESGMYWLLAWKVINALAIILVFYWYVRLIWRQ